MAELNTFLAGANARFAAYFQHAIRVGSAEEHYGIDEYSDVTMLSRPTIFITPREVCCGYCHPLRANLKL